MLKRKTKETVKIVTEIIPIIMTKLHLKIADKTGKPVSTSRDVIKTTKIKILFQDPRFVRTIKNVLCVIHEDASVFLSIFCIVFFE